MPAGMFKTIARLLPLRATSLAAAQHARISELLADLAKPGRFLGAHNNENWIDWAGFIIMQILARDYFLKLSVNFMDAF